MGLLLPCCTSRLVFVATVISWVILNIFEFSSDARAHTQVTYGPSTISLDLPASWAVEYSKKGANPWGSTGDTDTQGEVHVQLACYGMGHT